MKVMITIIATIASDEVVLTSGGNNSENSDGEGGCNSV